MKIKSVENLFRSCRISVPAALISLCAAGCSLFLPAGEPPEGNIVDNRKFADVRDLNAYESRLVIRLTASAMMKNNFPEGLYIEASDQVIADMLHKIAADAAATAGRFLIADRPEGAWLLQGKIEKNTVSVTLLAPRTRDPEWQECAPASVIQPPQ